MAGHFGYRPVINDVEAELQTRRPARLLVVGSEVPDDVHHAGQIRQVERPSTDLPQGVYVFERGDETDLMAVSRGARPASPTSGEPGASKALDAALAWMDAWWVDAVEIPRPQFNVNSPALTRGEGQEAQIRARDYDRGQWWYRVRVDGRTVSLPERELLAPTDDDDPYEWIERVPAPVHRFAATLTRAKLSENLTDTVYSFRATKTLFRAYQFRPIIRLLQTGALRLLIADEVGLGKTIEAGLVWTELDARKQADRVLVVCPSMLVPKWRAEMRERFSYELTELDREALDDLVTRIDEDRMPARFAGICSIERLRVWNGLEQLAEMAPRFDLIIADEAHAFRNSETKSYALGALLSDWADALIFLSATPLNLGNDDLFSLLELLAPGEFDDRAVLEQLLEPNAVLHELSASLLDPETTNSDRLRLLDRISGLRFGPAVMTRPEYSDLVALLSTPSVAADAVAKAKRLIGELHALSAVVTRTRKVEVQERKAVRQALPVDVVWTDPEWNFYQTFERWQFARAEALGLPVGFVTQMPRRLASTCLPAARDQVLNLSSWWDDDLDSDDTDLEWDMSNPPEDLIALAKQLGDVDSKFDSLIKQLSPIIHSGDGRRSLVFTFSRKALAYLAHRLSEHFRVAVLHGGVDQNERHRVMAAFRNHEYDVVVASRVASEGLDFEFCSAVVNYDLPWNPMEVEQRIGRIDRFGQQEDVIYILNFHTPGTIETDIIQRVHDRIGVFRDSIGELEPILQSQMADLRKTMFDFKLTEEQRRYRLDAMLAAIEGQRLALNDVENASSFLAATDNADIDGLEDDLVSSGKYIGQLELVELLRDWAAHDPGAECRLDKSGTHLTFKGTAALELHLRGVETAGERSRSEIEQLARAMRDERDVILCLDQEHARQTGHALLAANHPMVRAALRVPGSTQARFAYAQVTSEEVESGTYLVLVEVARWNGLRPATEFWAASVDLDTGLLAAPEVGDLLLANLAEAGLHERVGQNVGRLDSALRTAERALRVRRTEEEERRRAANEALVETRRISLRETHARKVEQIGRRIATVRERGNTSVIHLHEAQRKNQDRLLHEAEVRLDDGREGSMVPEVVAVCVLEVVAP